MEFDFQGVEKRLINIFCPESGYFGRIYTWGQKQSKYEYVGYELTESIAPTLKKMSEYKRENLLAIMAYFEIHACPLKELLNPEQKGKLAIFYYEIAWSHFMTVIMFGMLELVVKGKRGENLRGKGEKIKKFLIKNLSAKIQDSIAERYLVNNIFGYKKKIKTFSDVVDHLWSQIRCGFIHDAGIEYRGLEPVVFSGGIGIKNDPLKLNRDVPMCELLQTSWQAILNFYGYKGFIKLKRMN